MMGARIVVPVARNLRVRARACRDCGAGLRPDGPGRRARSSTPAASRSKARQSPSRAATRAAGSSPSRRTRTATSSRSACSPVSTRSPPTKDNLTQSFNQRISLDMVEVNFALKPGGDAGNVSDEERKKADGQDGGGQDRVRRRASRSATRARTTKRSRSSTRSSRRCPNASSATEQHRRELPAEEGLGAGRSVLQEGDRGRRELGRRATTGSPTSTTRRRSSIRRRRRARRP